MKAEIVAIGTELLLGQILNTNAQYLSERLALEGINVFYHQVVGDNEERLQQAIALAHSRSDVIILSGGLGPTEDDLTREAVAGVLRRPLHLDMGVLAHLQGIFDRLGKEMSPNNRQQAMVIEGAKVLSNPRGTAPGQYVEAEGRHYFILPGPPTEMKLMFIEQVVPILRAIMGPQQTIRSRELRIFGIGEPAMEMKVADLLNAQSNPTIAPLASEGECRLRITAKAESEAEAYALIASVEGPLCERLGHYVYGVDEETLPIAIAKRLTTAGQTLSVFESKTGGAVAAMITEAFAQTPFLKQVLVAVDRETAGRQLGLDAHQLESVDVYPVDYARLVAESMKRLSGTDWTIAVTEFEVPSEEVASSNIRKAYLAVAGPEETTTMEIRIRGDHNQLRIRAAKHALHLLLQFL